MARNTFFSSIISEGQGNPSVLFLSVYKLLQRARQFPLTPSSCLCTDFMVLLLITTIYHQLHNNMPTIWDSSGFLKWGHTKYISIVGLCPTVSLRSCANAGYGVKFRFYQK